MVEPTFASRRRRWHRAGERWTRLRHRKRRTKRRPYWQDPYSIESSKLAGLRELVRRALQHKRSLLSYRVKKTE